MACIVIDKKNPTNEDIVNAWFDNFVQQNPEITPEIIQREIEGAKDIITKIKLTLWEGGGTLGSTAHAYNEISCYRAYIIKLEAMKKGISR